MVIIVGVIVVLAIPCAFILGNELRAEEITMLKRQAFIQGYREGAGRRQVDPTPTEPAMRYTEHVVEIYTKRGPLS